MIINSSARLDLLTAARAEIRHVRPLPATAFYEKKLAAVWDRARKSAAYQHLPAYSPEAFADLPVTPKERLKAAPMDFFVGEMGGVSRYYETTGTTGLPTPTPRSVEDIVWNVSAVADQWSTVLSRADRVLSLLPSDIVPVGDIVTDVCAVLDLPCTRAYPFATGISDWDRIASVWKTFQPTVVFAAPGVFLQMTRLLAQRGVLADLTAPVRTVMLLGEVSVPAMRRRLAGTWDAAVLDASYGSTETGTLAATCPEDSLHLLSGSNYFELNTEEGIMPPRPGTGGRLVVTPLNLHARPLVRYDTGDEVVLRAGCACGDPSPVVEPVGRANDTVEVAGARVLPRHLEEIVYAEADVTGYLVEVTADAERARLLLERNVRASREDEDATAERITAATRKATGVEWDRVIFVNTLPAATKSGASQKSWKRSNIRVGEW
ncbi:phenylacetate--CoA ligase family protein [Myceligenerans xiligouense]|uniref:Phenylacetate-CoA ligase n=1 Tax=Myceligenerans xiligouense TaxID=253184 RepID=A0A3N4YKY7_9MICO|nr:AMP-binding protein [Myceligenerans xiligouense]RPF20747.1 phenylacetate-CoA ligase [Myceligenerans xiligouense]